MTEEIRTERRAGALWIVVDRPAARNAMTFAMYDRIAANLVRLAALVGLGRVKELVFTARLIDAQEARAIGLVTDIVDGEDALEARVGQLVEELGSYAPLTLHATKEMTRRIRARMMPDEAADLVALCYTSTDFREGVKAFIERRKPVWKGT